MWVETIASGTHRNVTQDSQQDVDEEVGVATTLEKDTQGWEDDGKKDLADVADRILAVISQTKLAMLTYDAVKGMLAVLWSFDRSSLSVLAVW